MMEELMSFQLGKGSSYVWQDFLKQCQLSSFCEFVLHLLTYEQYLPAASCFNNDDSMFWKYHTAESPDDINNCVGLLTNYAERHRLISVASAIEQLLNMKKWHEQNEGCNAKSEDPVRKQDGDHSQQNHPKRKRGRPRKRKLLDSCNQEDSNNYNITTAAKEDIRGDENNEDTCNEQKSTNAFLPAEVTEELQRRPRRSCKRFERIMAELSKSNKKNEQHSEKGEEDRSERDEGVSSHDSQEFVDQLDLSQQRTDGSCSDSEIIVFRVELEDTPNEEEDTIFKEKSESGVRKCKRSSRSRELNKYYTRRKMHAMNKMRDGRVLGTQTQLSRGNDPSTCMAVEFGANVKVHRIANYLHACSRRCQTDEYNCYTCDCTLTEQKEYSDHMTKYHNDSDSYFCKLCNCVIENKEVFQSHMFCHDGKFYCMQCQLIFISREALLRHFGSLFTLHCPISECDAVMYSCNEDKYFAHLKDHVKRVPAVLKVMHGVQPGIERTVTLGAEFPLWMIVNLTGEVWNSVSTEQIQIATDLQLEILDAIKETQNKNFLDNLYSSCSVSKVSNKKIEKDQLPNTEEDEETESDGDKFDMTKLPLNILNWYQHVNISIECGKLKIERKKVYECVTCDKQFSSIGGKLRHDQQHHQSAEEKTEQSGSDDKDKERNVIRYECDRCGSSFSSKMGCIRHMQRVHHYDPVNPNNARKYLCRFCTMNFRSADMLNDHVERSHKTNRYNCEQCSYSTCKAIRMKLHVQHVHEKKVEFKCNVCGQEFIYKNLYKLHMDCHNGLKPFHCDTCGQGFATKQRCQRHQTVHTKPNKTGHAKKHHLTGDEDSIIVSRSNVLDRQSEQSNPDEQMQQEGILETETLRAEVAGFGQDNTAEGIISGLAGGSLPSDLACGGLPEESEVYFNPDRVTILDPNGQVMNVIRQNVDGDEQFVLVTLPPKQEEHVGDLLGMKPQAT